MDLVHHVDLETAYGRLVARRIEEGPDVVDSRVTCGIDLEHVDMAVGGNGDTLLAHAAWLGRDTAVAVGADTIEGTRQNPCGGRLADAANTGQEEGLGDPSALDRVPQGAHEDVLAAQLVQGLGTVLARQNAVFPGCMIRKGHGVPW